MSDNARDIFLQALEYVQQEFYVDAIEAFRSITSTAPDSPLADDATFNLGLCYLKIQQLDRARECFEKILSDYPDGTIDPGPDQKEFGRTAAKALLALVELALANGAREQASAFAERLEEYQDSWVLQPGDVKKTYHDLALDLLNRFNNQTEGSPSAEPERRES